MNLFKQLSEPSVKVMRGAPKKSQLTNECTNIWCQNYKEHGHVANKCPTSQSIRNKANVTRPAENLVVQAMKYGRVIWPGYCTIYGVTI